MHLIFLLLTSALAFAGTDVQFLEEMTMHHKQAVHMAKMVDKKLSSSDVKKMNKTIMVDQQKDIARMAKWKKELGKFKRKGFRRQVSGNDVSASQSGH